jgi:putative transposase
VANSAKEDDALFHYRLIAPLLDPDLQRGDQAEQLQALAMQEHAHPQRGRVRRSVSTLKRYLRRYRQAGPGSKVQALQRKVRNDKGKQRSLRPEVLTLAIRLRKEVPQRSVAQLIHLLELQGVITKGEVSRPTLDRHLRAHGCSRSAVQAGSKGFRRWQRDRRNALWQSDAKHGPHLPDPADPSGKRMRRTVLLAFIDDRSRLITHAQFYWDEKLPSLEDTFKKAILKRGIPDRIYVDNGRTFISTRLGVICTELGIRRLNTRPYEPTAKGKIERFWKTVDDSFMPELRALKVRTLDELNTLFWAWLEGAYHHREHRDLGGKPAEVFANDPHPLRLADPAQVADAFLQRETRKVDRTGCVSLEGVLYEVGPLLARQKVELRYDPYDPQEIQVWQDGTRKGSARPVDPTAQREHSPEAPPGQEPTSGVNYLKLLHQQQEQALQQKAKQLSFRQILGQEGK